MMCFKFIHLIELSAYQIVMLIIDEDLVMNLDVASYDDRKRRPDILSAFNFFMEYYL